MPGNGTDEGVEEIRRQLMRYRFDPEFHGRGNRVPMRQFALLVGISRQALYHIMARDYRRLSRQSLTRFHAAIAEIERGLRWRRTSRDWVALMKDGSEPPSNARRHENFYHGHPNL
jgi:hypothetical protein